MNTTSHTLLPLVSIIMAVKNTEPYLEQCLDSILAQTYTHWELLAANDHSTDKSPEILERYAQTDSRVKIIHSRGHKLIPALKEGYAISSGDLLNRMDSDDYMPSNKLELLVSEWLKFGKGHIIAGGTSHFTEHGEVGQGFLRYDKWLNHLARSNTHFKEIYKECVIPSHCWLIHREDFDMAGGFEPEIYPEDYDLCFRFYKLKLKVIGIPEILHFWRDRLERISRTWECYKDNRYFELKLRYFKELDWEPSRSLVLWGGGRNGKDLAKLLIHVNIPFQWVCDNAKKIGHQIYNVLMQDFDIIPKLDSPQILIVVSNPDERSAVRQILVNWGKQPGRDYWFFL